MILTTDRLRLRPMRPEDIEAFLPHLNDWEVQQWLIAPPFPYRHSDGEAFLAIVRNDHAGRHPTFFVVAAKASDAALGVVSIAIDDAGNGELGYWLGRDHWGQGLAREAVSALLNHARAHPMLRRLFAITDPENLRSQRVLANCGLADLGLQDRKHPSRRGALQSRRFELALRP